MSLRIEQILTSSYRVGEGGWGHNEKIFYGFITCFGPFAAFFFLLIGKVHYVPVHLSSFESSHVEDP